MSQRGKFSQVEILLLALGSNVAGPWGEPKATLQRTLRELEREGIEIIRTSNLYVTQPLGDTPQPRYLNAVLHAKAAVAPGQLLRLLKRIERRAGRTATRAMAPRPLDIDILDYGGRRLGWPPRPRQRGSLVLPHPEMHVRAFVLAPLQEVAPAWRHPVLGRSVKELLTRLPAAERAGVGQTLDFWGRTCDKQAS
jgi:2-amino-4-hydroxy-6-hydroxymethyldihydropteridine diphosphokinase